MKEFLASPIEMLACLLRNRSLIMASARREVLGRYRGSILGILWSFFNPLLMLAVYTIVFSVVFNARWSTGGNSKIEFALLLFAGLMIFNLFAECINRAPTLILSNANYVKKVVYPLEILPAITLLASLFHTLISLGVWLVAYILFIGPPHATTLLLPIVILPLTTLIMGLSWILASLGVFLRDVSQVVGIATSALMFLSPIFYPVDAFPENFRYLLYLNPLTPAIEMTRDVLYWGRTPNAVTLIIYWFAAALIAWLGFSWFQKTRTGFADVL